MSDKPSNAEQRAAAILLPGEELEDLPLKDPTTGSDVIDMMMKVVGKELADSQATMAAVQANMDLLPDGYAGPRTLEALSENPGTVVRNMTRNTILLPGGKTLIADERILIPTEDVLGDLGFRDYIAKGMIKCTEILRTPKQKKTKLDLNFGPEELDLLARGPSGNENPDSITMQELTELQRVAFNADRSKPLAADLDLSRVMNKLLTKYGFSIEYAAINLETGKFIAR